MIKNFKVYVVKSGSGSVSFARRKQAQPLVDALEKFGHTYEIVEEKRTVEVPDL